MNNSVATKVKEGHEYCLVIHCVAHRLELAILAAIKGHNGLIYKHYTHSSKALRKREIRNIAEAMHGIQITEAEPGTKWTTTWRER